MICEVYLDDVIVHGKTTEDFLQRLETIFIRFTKHKIILKPSKCKFGLTRVEYVGRDISQEGLTMSATKRQTVNNFPPPILAKELKSFLGLVNYFRMFIEHHSDIVRALQDLIPDYKRGNKILWNKNAELAFTTIKQMINDCPTLYFLNYIDHIYLHTDASDYGIEDSNVSKT